jgi:succinyl-diaminopimelate desuccinylase
VIANAVTAVTGRTPSLSTSGGTSDARFIKDVCAVAEFGMVGETAHKVDENVLVSDLARLTDIYLAVLKATFQAGR